MYKIPPDVKEKEKVIGGYLTLIEFLWLLGGLGSGLFLFVIFWLLTSSLFVGLFFFILGPALAAPFAFYKKKDLALFDYLKFRRQLLKRNVVLPNTKKERDR